MEVDSRCLNDQKLCFIDLLKKKCFIAKCLFKKKKYFISAELIQLLSLVFKMEIFDRSAGLLLDLSFLILPINVTCT